MPFAIVGCSFTTYSGDIFPGIQMGSITWNTGDHPTGYDLEVMSRFIEVRHPKTENAR